MSERPCGKFIAPATLLIAAGLALGCGGSRPALPEGLVLDELINSRNLAFFLEPEPEGAAVAVDFDHTGDRILTAHEDGQVLLWDAHDGRAIASLANLEWQAVAARFSPDGEAIAAADAATDGRVKIWSAATGEPIATCETTAEDIAWSPDGARIVVGARTGAAVVCDARTGERTGSLQHGAQVDADSSTSGGAPVVEITAVGWSSDGEHVVTAGTAGVVGFWDAATLEEVHSDLGHTGAIHDIASGLQPDQIASAGEDGSVQILTPDSAEPVATFYNESVPVSCIAFSADRTRLAWGDGHGRIKIWDASSGEQLLAIEAHLGTVTDLAWSPDGTRLISAGADAIVRVSDTASGDEVLVLASRASGRWPGRATWSPDGKRLAAIGSGAALEIWDPSADLKSARLARPHHEPIALAWSPDGRRLASGGRDEAARVWNAEITAFAGEIRGLDGPVLDLEWSPDGEKLAAAGWGGVHLLAAKDGRAVFSSLEHEGAVNGVAFAPDGERLATAGADGSIKLWSTSEGEVTGERSTGATPVNTLDWNGDGTRLALGSDDGVVWIWNPRSDEIEHTLEHPRLGPVFGVDWSPDDARLAVVDGNGGLYLWTEDEGSSLEMIADGGGAAWSVEWRSDGDYLLVGASGGAWIHRLGDGERLTLGSFDRQGEDVWLAFTEQGLFCGDEAAFGKLAFRVKDDLRAGALLPTEAMVEAFYRENLLTEFLAGEPIAPPGED
jgi:WD40 repeat protein